MNEKQRQTVEKRITENKKLVLEQLEKMPIIQACCEKLSIGRSTLYRWMQEDSEFKKAVEEAVQRGSLLVNDLAESKVIGGIKDGNYSFTSLWLRHNHPKYANTLKLQVPVDEEDLTPEQEAVVRKALEMTLSTKSQKTYESAKRDHRKDDDGSEDSSRNNQEES